MTEAKWRVAWKALATGVEGHGKYVLTKDEVDELVAQLNADASLPPMEHWAEQQEEAS